MTDRNMLDVVPRAFRLQRYLQVRSLPSLKLKASYLVERASDGGLRNPLRACPGYKMEGLGDVNVRSAQTLTCESQTLSQIRSNRKVLVKSLIE